MKKKPKMKKTLKISLIILVILITGIASILLFIKTSAKPDLTINELQLIDHETRIGTNETNISTNTTNIGTNATDIQAIEDSVGAVNGIAPLDANAEVPLANLPQSVQYLAAVLQQTKLLGRSVA